MSTTVMIGPLSPVGRRRTLEVETELPACPCAVAESGVKAQVGGRLGQYEVVEVS
jgi:hypothetical protein